MRPREWTEERDTVLRTMWLDNVPIVEIASHLGVTKDAITNRRTAMGLKVRTSANWTLAEEETLKAMWEIGKSAAEIAVKIPGRSRNAVIGRVHRLGLAGRADPTAPSRPASVKPAPKPKPAPRITSALVPGSHPPKPSKPAVVFGALPSLSPAERDDLREKHRISGQAAIKSASRKIVDSPNARPFLDARGGCKWPIEADDGMHMCCNPITRGSYCTSHAAIAYTGIPQRQNLTNGKAASFLARNDGVERVRKPKADNDSLWDDVRAA